MTHLCLRPEERGALVMLVLTKLRLNCNVEFETFVLGMEILVGRILSLQLGGESLSWRYIYWRGH